MATSWYDRRMIWPPAPSERATLYPDAPLLGQQEAKQKFTAWWAGNVVRSEVVPVGIVGPTPDELVALQGRRMARTNYGALDEQAPLWPATTDAMSAFAGLVLHDITRCGLQGQLRTAVWAGHYRQQIHREPWHSDNFHYPSVRWTATVGVGSTAGAVGEVCESHVSRAGDLLPEVTVGEAGQLQPQTYEPGIVLRFMNSGDIHAGPPKDGARIMLQATLELVV